jgi:hypothetical protein
LVACFLDHAVRSSPTSVTKSEVFLALIAVVSLFSATLCFRYLVNITPIHTKITAILATIIAIHFFIQDLPPCQTVSILAPKKRIKKDCFLMRFTDFILFFNGA